MLRTRPIHTMSQTIKEKLSLPYSLACTHDNYTMLTATAGQPMGASRQLHCHDLVSVTKLVLDNGTASKILNLAAQFSARPSQSLVNDDPRDASTVVTFNLAVGSCRLRKIALHLVAVRPSMSLEGWLSKATSLRYLVVRLSQVSYHSQASPSEATLTMQLPFSCQATGLLF